MESIVGVNEVGINPGIKREYKANQRINNTPLELPL